MKLKIKKQSLTSLAVFSAALAAGASSQAATFLTSGGNINIPANWDTGSLPLVGETGTVDIDASWPTTSAAGALNITGDLVFGGGSTLTAALDIVGFNPNSVTFNDVTVNVDDDIFTGGATGNFIFNMGSVTNVDDDFEANSGGTITVAGGTHNVGLASPNSGLFGAQNNSTLNFLGGTVTSDSLRSTASGTINVGGDATLTAAQNQLAGALDFTTDWTGSLTLTDLSGSAWETQLLSGATFGGAAIDATVFANNFEVTNGGQTLSLIPIPEPSSLLLSALGALTLLRRRRK